VRYEYSHTAAVMRVLERVGAQEVEHGFTSGGVGGEVEFTVGLPQHAILPDLLREQTAGAVTADTLARRLLYSPL
jgi:hypothetical protein